jgi:hypothetical protein
MDLSGDVEEDLKNLIFSYNLYGSKILTSIKDVNNNIFKFLKAKDLVNFSMVNHQTINLFDTDFWMLKFKHDDLPIIKDKLNAKSYKLMFEAKITAEYVMKINQIEVNRDKTLGLIRIIYRQDNVLLKSILSNIENDAIKAVLNRVTNLQKRLDIGILPLKDDNYNYEAKFYYDLGDNLHINLLGHLHCSYKMILYILTLVRFNITEYNILIIDKNGLKFIVDDNYLLWLKNRLPGRYKQDKTFLIKRMGILDSLKFGS